MLIASARVTKFALQNFFRNFWLSLITISMMALTLISVNVLLLVNFIADQAVETVERRVEVSVFFKQNTTEEKVNEAVVSLRNLSQVKDTRVLSADEVLARFRDRHAKDEAILGSLEEIGDNPFGPTLIVTANSVEDYDTILKALDHPGFRDEIRQKDFQNYKEIIERIRSAAVQVRWFGLGLAALFFFIALLIVFNTVRMGIVIHKDEIGIMRLVGASSWFVRAPYLLEILLYSFLASSIVAAIALPLTAIVDPFFSNAFGHPIGLVAWMETSGIKLFIVQYLSLSLFAMMATWIAMRKYLRV